MELTTNILINGTDQTGLLQSRILAFTIEEHESLQLDTLQLILNNADNAITPPQTNAKLELSIGFGETISMGEYIVQLVEHNHGCITLKAIVQDLNKGRVRQTKVFENQSLENILQTIAGNLGLTLELDKSLKTKQIPYFLQNNQTDLYLLQQLGELYYATAKIANNKLIFMAKDSPQTAVIIQDKSILSIHKEDSEYKPYSGVKTSYWDVKSASPKEIKQGEEPFLSLPAIYHSTLLQQLVSSKAKQIAQKTMLNLTLVGTPQLQAGLTISIPKNSQYQDFTGNYKITKTNHAFNGQTYTTQLTCYKSI